MKAKRVNTRTSVALSKPLAQWAAEQAKREGQSRTQFVESLLRRERDTQLSKRTERLEKVCVHIVDALEFVTAAIYGRPEAEHARRALDRARSVQREGGGR